MHAAEIDALLDEYRQLWRLFRDAPANRGPDQPPRQVVFDIARVEKLKAAGVPDPFDLVRTDKDAIKTITRGRTLDESIDYNGGMWEPDEDVGNEPDEEPEHADMLIDDIPMAPF